MQTDTILAHLTTESYNGSGFKAFASETCLKRAFIAMYAQCIFQPSPNRSSATPRISPARICKQWIVVSKYMEL